MVAMVVLLAAVLAALVFLVLLSRARHLLLEGTLKACVGVGGRQGGQGGEGMACGACCAAGTEPGGRQEGERRMACPGYDAAMPCGSDAM